MNSEYLYNLFHKESFKKNLSLDLMELDELKSYQNFIEYVNLTSNNSNKSIEDFILDYEQNTSPTEKLKPVVSFFEQLNVNPKSCLDFGCGNGYCLNFLSKIYPSKFHVGIEPTLPNEASNNSFSILNSLDSLIGKSKFDLILCIHSLHHIEFREHDSIFLELKSLMNYDSYLYIYEDTWNEVKSSAPLLVYDDIFNTFETAQKIDFFRLNEFWANKWFYQREFDSANTNYLSLQEWQEKLVQSGFDIVESSAYGFNFNRIHGVPSGWIIAKINEVV